MCIFQNASKQSAKIEKKYGVFYVTTLFGRYFRFSSFFVVVVGVFFLFKTINTDMEDL